MAEYPDGNNLKVAGLRKFLLQYITANLRIKLIKHIFCFTPYAYACIRWVLQVEGVV
jgi:hypothetical protein